MNKDERKKQVRNLWLTEWPEDKRTEDFVALFQQWLVDNGHGQLLGPSPYSELKLFLMDLHSR